MTRWRALVVVLLLGLALGWPLLAPAMSMSHAAVMDDSTAMPAGCNGCDHQQGNAASCPVVLCVVAPAILPSGPLSLAVPKVRTFAVASVSIRGQIPETLTPPPRILSQS